MKKLILSTLFALSTLATFAQYGYKLEINFKQDIPDSMVFLAHYYAKPLPTIYKTDSAVVINKRKAVFESRDSVLGGIYMILFQERSKFAELVLNNGEHLVMNIDTTDMPANISFKNSAENERYQEYQKFLTGFGKRQLAIMEDLKTAKNAKDSANVRERSAKISKEVNKYRKDFISANPNAFVSTVFRALSVPDVPEGKHYLPGTKTVDSAFSYNFYKKHYWDDFNFKDDRLMNTPIYDAKLEEYFNRLVIPVPDSMNFEADQILAKTRGRNELFKYTLHWLAGNAERSKVMGMDEVFVHLVEKYYMKGDAYWLDSAGLSKYEDKAKKIAPNVLGNTAPDINMQDVWTLQEKPLSQFQSKYTLLIFWSKECSHCKEEMPKIDSVYNKVLKNKGVNIYAVSTEGELTEIQKTIDKLKIKSWTNVVDGQNSTEYRKKYDVYSTPKIYLLDENKKIIGKNLDHSNIAEVIEFNKRKANNK